MDSLRRNNHTVTRGYIANWRGAKNGKTGIWYFDIHSRSIVFSQGERAPFAVTKDIYAPIGKTGARDDRLERWFSRSESQLCEFTREFRTDGNKNWKPAKIELALESIVSMGNRGDYAVAGIDQFFREAYPHESDDQIRVRTLDNIYMTTKSKTAFFRQGMALILNSDEPVFMTNDQPFWDMTPQNVLEPIAVFPLSPTRALVLAPHQRQSPGEMRFGTLNAKDVPAIMNFAKSAAMRMARRWVVCASEEQAKVVADYLTDEVIAEAWQTDRLLKMPADHSDRLFDN